MQVSVIIPSYNRASLVRETIENMLAQTWEDKEIIVVDDGSTDDSRAVLESFGNKIRVFYQENRGVGAARNLGLRRARGAVIQFMDSDDLAGPLKIEKQLETLQRTGADIVYGPWMKARIRADTVSPIDQVLQQDALPKGSGPIRWHSTRWSIILQSCLFRRSIIDQAGPFREDWKSAEDQDLFLRCLLAGAKLVHCPDSLLVYRIHEEDKLTTTGLSDLQRALDWASHLIEIGRLCKNTLVNEDPLQWRGFRFRIWQALNEFRRFDPVRVQAHVDQLSQLLGPHFEPWMRVKERARRSRSGLRFRLKGTRYHRCFRAGPLNRSQLGELQELGFAVEGFKTSSNGKATESGFSLRGMKLQSSKQVT